MTQFGGLPPWAGELAQTYKAGTVNTFILHGNTLDVAPARERNAVRFVALKEFLTKQLFSQRQIVIHYDQAAGIDFPDNAMAESFHRVVKAIDTVKGTSFHAQLPRDPARALPLIERFLRTRLMDDGKGEPLRAAIVVDYAHFIAPSLAGYRFSQDDASTLIALHKWSSDPAFTKADITFVLICENLSDLHPVLVRSPYTAKIQIPLPESDERLEYLRTAVPPESFGAFSTLTPEEMAAHTAGLSRVNLEHLLARAKLMNAGAAPKKLDFAALWDQKKALIEKECFGLLEFLKPRRGLEAVSGHDAAKRWLREDARLLKEGRFDALPMGYLICGPVGTGKTFLMTCYAGELGIPCVVLRNFRSQWQGVTEGNWEKILTTLRATGPVAVIIDEADAAIGDRDAAGDSGTSSRVFSMLAQQMGDTRYRGKILWFLLTCRPDLLPIDMKRQGRAEVHVPLFHPEGDDEKRTYFTILAKKNDVELDGADVPKDALKMRLSGADIEGLVIRAKRRALLAGSAKIRKQDMEEELKGYLPPTYPEETELQILAAVLECTHQDFLPAEYRSLDRSKAAAKLSALKEIVGR